MSRPTPRNVAASYRARLLDLSRQRGEDFQFVLSRWAVERFLYRLGQSPYKDRFVLKGAMLFLPWTGALYRPTRDLDLLGSGDPDVNEVVRVIQDICRVEAEDGLMFDFDGITGERIREDAHYEGVRITAPVSLDGARIPLRIDIGFGDVVEPAPEELEFPTLLTDEPPRLRAYPPEASIAEKVHAMTVLGIANSRMKDFYDIWVLASSREFHLDVLRRSIQATFEGRKTPLPEGLPFALTAEFLTDAAKKAQWQAFVGRLATASSTPTLEEVGGRIGAFLLPVVAESMPATLNSVWMPGGPWK